MLDGIRRFAHRLGFSCRRVGQDRTPISSDLLASPLDARHYVTEDWAQPAMPPSDDTDAAPRHVGVAGMNNNRRAKKRDRKVALTKVWRFFASTKKSAS